jgi:hypothetical protein
MKKILLSALMLGAMAGSSFAIFQMDVDASLVPDGGAIDGSTMYLFMNPAPFPNTGIAGPDGFPLMYHVLFDYDAQIGGGAVDYVELTAGDCTQTWTPAPFSVFYTPGPAFPANGVYEAFSGDCFGGGTVDANEAPVSFGLADAYPNPFNPSTTIDYSVEMTEAVALNVFNINGQLVRTLVNGTVESGAHSVVFDAADLASGVYLYTLESASQSITKKMVLVK